MYISGPNIVRHEAQIRYICTTSLRVMFASRYTKKVVARSCRFLCLDSFSASVQLVTQCTLFYTVSLVFSH